MKRSLLIAALALSFSALTVSADELPARKAGLWEMSITSMPGPGQTVKMQQCTDAATDAKLMEMGGGLSAKMGAQCTQSGLRKNGDKFSADATCKVGPTNVKSHSEFSGDFNSAYQGQVVATYDPPMMGMKETTTLISAKWLGPCPAGQAPGDMIMPGGRKMNIQTLKNMGLGGQ